MCDKSFLVLSSAPFSPCFLKFFTYRIIFVSPPSYRIIFVSPPCILLYSCLMESNGIFQVALFLNQHYRYCFSNKMSTLTTKLVVFNLVVAGEDATDMNDEKSHDRVAEMVNF